MKRLQPTKTKVQKHILHFQPIVSIITLVLGILGTLLVTHVLAQTANNTIYACSQKQTGNLRMVAAGTTCHSDETAVTWNIQGPQGIPGPAGSGGNAAGLPFICENCQLYPYASAFQGKDFSNAQLHNVNFSGTDIHGIILKGAFLDGGDFSHTNVTGADFSNLMLPVRQDETTFTQPGSSGLKFYGSNLTNANFSNDSFYYAVNFSHANLQNTNFSGATFNSVDLTGAQNMSTANLTNTTWISTTCPDGYVTAPSGDTCVGHF